MTSTRLIGTTITHHSPSSPEAVFAFIVDADTPIKMIKPWGFLPGFKNFYLLDGDWKHAGARRRVTLTDQSTLTEQITTLKPAEYFDYQLTEFTSPALRFLAVSAYGQWWFKPEEQGTAITWRYSFTPQNNFVAPLLFIFVNLIYKGYMKAAMKHFQRIEAVRPMLHL